MSIFNKVGRFCFSGICLAGFYYAIHSISKLSGLALIALPGASLILLLLAVRSSLFAFSRSAQLRTWLNRICLSAASVLFAITLSEIVLKLLNPVLSRPDASQSVLMPKAWEKRVVQIPGAKYSYYWQGALHIHNDEGFRTKGAYTMEPESFRVLVLGDSLTYGYGVAEDKAYPSIIQNELSRSTRAKVYNLGRSGYQSEDILRTGRHWLSVLHPHLVIYGICLNDFLPSRVSQYKSNRRYEIPIPHWIKTRFMRETLLGAALTRGYDQLLLNIGLRNDFFEDILSNFKGYQTRFRNDLKALNQVAKGETGAPIIVVVLNQYPRDPRGRRISQIAESAAAEAGMQVVPTNGYYSYYSTHPIPLIVSKWEDHPNFIAHEAFADLLLPVIKKQPVFIEYKTRHPR